MVVAVAALVSLGVLASAGLAHLRHLRAFSAAIGGQGIWPEWSVLPLAAAVATVEAGVGAGGVVALIAADTPTVHTVLLATVTFVYCCYALYGVYLLRTRPGVPCACSGDMDRVDGAVVGRAATLGALALIAALHAPVAQGLVEREAVIVGLASVVYGLAVWALPTALHDPATIVAARASRGP